VHVVSHFSRNLCAVGVGLDDGSRSSNQHAGFPVLYSDVQQSHSIETAPKFLGEGTGARICQVGGALVNQGEPLPRAPVSETTPVAMLTEEAQRAFWWRVLAIAIDVLVLTLVDLLVNNVFGVTHITSSSPGWPTEGFTEFTSSTDVGWGWLIFVMLVYFIGFEVLFGATVGKWLVHLRVTDPEGRRVGVWPVVVRNVMRLVDGLPVGFLVGGAAALLSSRRQRLGDHLAQTLVIRREAVSAPLLVPTQLRLRLALVSAFIVAGLAFSGVFFYFGRPPLVVQSMMNTRDMMFSNGVSSYTLSAPEWGSGTVSYQIEYITERPVESCHAQLTLAWALPAGWTPRYGRASCDAHAP